MVLFTMFNIFSMIMIMNSLTLFSMFRLKSYSDDDCGPDNNNNCLKSNIQKVQWTIINDIHI